MIATNTNSNTNSNSNSKYKCFLCKKEYMRKASLDKHRILCDLKTKTKTELIVEEEETSNKPTYDELVKIVQELALKQAKMESKMEEMQQYIARKKQKLDIITHLNTNVNSTIGFLEWVTMSLQVSTDDFQSLFENNIFQTYQLILEQNLTNEDSSFIYPIKCFKDKANKFYICEKGENENENKSIWREAESTEITQLLKKIHSLLLSAITKWKLENNQKMAENDKLSDKYNKAIIKLMNLSFTADGMSNVNRIKNGLYNYLRVDI